MMNTPHDQDNRTSEGYERGGAWRSSSDEVFLRLIQDNKRILFKICHSYCRNKSDREDLAQEITERSEGYDRGGP